MKTKMPDMLCKWCQMHIPCEVDMDALAQTSEPYDGIPGAWHAHIRETCPRCGAECVIPIINLHAVLHVDVDNGAQ